MSNYNLFQSDTLRVAADTQVLETAQLKVAKDTVALNSAQTRLAAAAAALAYAQLRLQNALNALADYRTAMLQVLNQSMAAGIAIIGEIACTIANQPDTCNVDPLGVLPWFAINGCEKRSGFVCSGDIGFCICPPIVEDANSTVSGTQPNIGKDYAVWSAGTLKTSIEDIKSTDFQLTKTTTNEQENVAYEQRMYNVEQLQTSDAQLQLDSDFDQEEGAARQLAIDVAQWQLDSNALGVSQQQYESAVLLRDFLATRYGLESPVIAKQIEKLSRDNTALVRSAVAQVSTIDCKSDLDCQDSGGSLSFFAKLACLSSGTFVCDSYFESCACGSIALSE